MPFLTKYIKDFPLPSGDTLLLNTLTSAMDIVDPPTWEKIRSISSPESPVTEEAEPELFSSLRSRGYVFNDHQDEARILSQMRRVTLNAPFSEVPTNFVICPSMACNLRCTYCFQSDAQHIAYEKLTSAKLHAIFDYIMKCRKEYAEYRCDPRVRKFLGDVEPSISLFGGEPLLRANRDLVAEVLEFASSVPMQVRVVTNGTSIKHYAELIKKHIDVLAFQVTLDGARQSHDSRRIRNSGAGTFDAVCDGVDQLLDLGAFVALRVNVDRENVDELVDLPAVLEARGWTGNDHLFPYASVVQDFACDRPELLRESEMLEILHARGLYGTPDALFKQLLSTTIGFVEGFFHQTDGVRPWRLSYCEATNGSSFCFAPNGTITTCLTYVGRGDCTIGTFDETGVHVDKERLSAWTKRDPFRMPGCADCKYLLLCGGGCPVKSLERFEDIQCNVCSDIERTLEVYVHQKGEELVRGSAR